MTERMTRVEERITRVEERITRVEEHTTRVEERITRVESLLVGVIVNPAEQEKQLRYILGGPSSESPGMMEGVAEEGQLPVVSIVRLRKKNLKGSMTGFTSKDCHAAYCPMTFPIRNPDSK